MCWQTPFWQLSVPTNKNHPDGMFRRGFLRRKFQFIEQVKCPLPGRGCPGGAGVECGQQAENTAFYQAFSGYHFSPFHPRRHSPTPPPREGVYGQRCVKLDFAANERIGVPRRGDAVFLLAAATVVVAATAAAIAAAVVVAAVAVVATAAEQDQQDDDPAPVTATETIVIHKEYLQEFFAAKPLIPRYSAG